MATETETMERQIQACVLFLKFKEVKPFHTIFLDLVITSSDKSIHCFKKKLLVESGVKQKRQSLCKKESDIEVGYAGKLPSGNLSLSSFVESLTDLQWKLTLQKPYNDRNYTLLIKVIEKTAQDSLTHRKPGKAPFTVLQTKHFANALQIVLLMLILQ